VNPRRQIDLLVCATQFLTRLPTPPIAAFEPSWIARSARYFPVVGQIVGLISAGVWLSAVRIWPGWPAAGLALAAGMLITGGFHEDGLADTADGLGGGRTRERRLQIMKDSRIGSFGALALIAVTLTKAALLARMSPWGGALALVAVHGGARAMAVAVMSALPYAGDPALAKIKPTAQGVRRPEVALALALGLWPLLFLNPHRALLGLALAAASSTTLALLARRLIGGLTGDVLGAVEQLSEVALLMGAAAWTPA
jgi:adenosylcobinamide-GDP ribazoletransferase